MDKRSDQIKQILDRAESEIREIGAEAFRTSDDTAAAEARDVVSSLKALRSQLNSQTAGATPSLPSASSHKSEKPPLPSRQSRKTQKDKYPRYEVRHGSLVRIGWSKKQKAEYEHKVPRHAFDRTVKAMAQIAPSGKGPFTAEKIVEHTKDSTGLVPSYQAYVVIGLLREHNCVKQAGRDGYMIPNDISSCALQIWNQLTGDNK